MEPCECANSAMELVRMRFGGLVRDCEEVARQTALRMTVLEAAVNPVIRHMETAPSSEPVPTHPPHPDPGAWARSVEALGDEDPQVRMATTRAG